MKIFFWRHTNPRRRRAPIRDKIRWYVFGSIHIIFIFVKFDGEREPSLAGTRARGLGPREEASGADKIENLKLKVENYKRISKVRLPRYPSAFPWGKGDRVAVDEGSLLRKAKRDNVQALRIMKSCLWHSEIRKLSFYNEIKSLSSAAADFIMQWFHPVRDFTRFQRGNGFNCGLWPLGGWVETYTTNPGGILSKLSADCDGN